ncbi:MAG: glutathione S-transferase family protein [Ectothiorhodospiraceae bacterium]|nr:glutathione S-transferase family protein [Ectothiorhodospiraceae bacterium]
MLNGYGDIRSGNSYKVRLALMQLRLPHEWVHVDLFAKKTREPWFLEKNPQGKVPLLEAGDGVYLRESNAILCYLADRTPLLPEDRLLKAQVMQWLFFEQYSHEPYIAASHAIIYFFGRPPGAEAKLEEKRAPGYKALELMEQHLGAHEFFVGERYSIADIALYAYTHIAEEAEFELAGFPAVCAWLKRVEAQPGYVSKAELGRELCQEARA